MGLIIKTGKISTSNMDYMRISPVEKCKGDFVGVCSLGIGGFGSVHLVEEKQGIKRAAKLMMISDVRIKIMTWREGRKLLE
jgi:hypothetical protein